MQILYSLQEANLLRARIRRFLKLRDSLLQASGNWAIQDLMIASSRVRILLEYLTWKNFDTWRNDLKRLSRVMLKRLTPVSESEICLKFIESFREKSVLNPLVAEVLVYGQKRTLERCIAKAIKRISKKDFARFDKFLIRCKGSRTRMSCAPALLRNLRDAFMNFHWKPEIDDESLHRLAILTEKFRYTLEIYERLANCRFKNLLIQSKTMQDHLSKIHDLYILDNYLSLQKHEWNEPEVVMISGSISEIIAVVARRRSQLRRKVYPLYSRVANIIFSELNDHLRSTQKMTIPA